MTVNRALPRAFRFLLYSSVALAANEDPVHPPDPCKVAGVCPGAYPPGHSSLGSSWFSIGRSSSPIISLTAKLSLPRPPQDIQGVLVINPSLENTVSGWSGEAKYSPGEG